MSKKNEYQTTTTGVLTVIHSIVIDELSTHLRFSN